ncbi:MAG: hypothetical protein ISN29_02465 [Gammaproteobacteria bacterium AqS3]|nr:hypothetical protein [Gammaproteobacteria bacterium AqS3]
MLPLKPGNTFVDTFDGEQWVTIQEVHKNLKESTEKAKSILDEKGNHVPIRIRDYLGGVVWSNQSLINKEVKE